MFAVPFFAGSHRLGGHVEFSVRGLMRPTIEPVVGLANSSQPHGGHIAIEQLHVLLNELLLGLLEARNHAEFALFLALTDLLSASFPSAGHGDRAAWTGATRAARRHRERQPRARTKPRGSGLSRSADELLARG